MADRLYEDLDISISNYQKHGIDDYDDEEDDEADEDYEDERLDELEKVHEKTEDLACPFCFEDFDVLGFCCHIDADHRMDVKPGICPVCAAKVRVNMVSHVITLHESLLKALGNTQHRSSRSRSAVYLLRKEMQEKHYRYIQESPKVDISSDPAADSTLLSFVNNRQHAERSLSNETSSSTSSEATVAAEISHDNSSDRKQQPSVSAEASNEKARRCEFLQGLVLSTIFEDDL